MSPPWPSGYKRWNPTLVPVVRARFEPRCGRPHFAPTCNGVRVCGKNRTEAREREWAEGTVSSQPGTLKFRMKFWDSTVELRDRVVGSGPAQQAMLSEGSDSANPPNQNIRTKLKKNGYLSLNPHVKGGVFPLNHGLNRFKPGSDLNSQPCLQVFFYK